MQKLGTFIWFGYRIPIRERVRLIHETGFETVLHWWDDSFIEIEGFSKEEQADIIRKEGLSIENAHLQPRGVNELWKDTLDGQAIYDRHLADIDGLAKSNISTAVMHLTSGMTPPPVSSIGRKRLKLLVERAQRQGVRIAVENVRHTDILRQVLNSDASEILGFCYDSGHDQIWSETPYALLKEYENRLFAVHLHDNMGINDDHLPPGEGLINWSIIRAGIEHSTYKGSLTLESDSAEIPLSRTPRDHLKRHFDGAKNALTIQ